VPDKLLDERDVVLQHRLAAVFAASIHCHTSFVGLDL